MNNYGETYIGSRYVPVFDGEWSNNKAYEPLTVVQSNGNSYTSKTYVPVGVDINDERYWVRTGNYNAQIEELRERVDNLCVIPQMFGAKGDGVTDDTAAFNRMIDFVADGGEIHIPNGTYLITAPITLNKMVTIRGNGAWQPYNWNNSYENIGSVLKCTGDGLIVSRSGTIIEGICLKKADPALTGVGLEIVLDPVMTSANEELPAIANNFKNMFFHNFGIAVKASKNTFKTVFENVVSWGCYVGFDFAPEFGTLTSITMINCWAARAGEIGYKFRDLNYSALINCCSDSNRNGYQFNDCKGINLTACGAEQSSIGSFTFNNCCGVTMNSCVAYGGNIFNYPETGSLITANNTERLVVQGCYEYPNEYEDGYGRTSVYDNGAANVYINNGVRYPSVINGATVPAETNIIGIAAGN